MKKTLKHLTQYLRKKSKKQSLLNEYICADRLSYNNFYEFGSTKNIKRKAEKLSTSPWNINIGGLVDKEISIDFDDLIRKVSLEERIYRLRCVEAWSLLVPWIGFPLNSLLKLVVPKSSAKYLVMKTWTEKI